MVGDDGLPVFPSEERCQANRDAGKLIFMTGFDFAAAAGILEVIAAAGEGYYEEMCLEVELQSGLSPGNAAALAAGTVQLVNVSTFGELVRLNVNGETDMVAFGQLGHTSLNQLLTPAGSISDLTELEGKTVGIKGDLPSAIHAMMAGEGLERGTFEELLLDGFDPVAHMELGIDALPVFRSNEPATLDAAGMEYDTWDPLDFDVPASFATMANTMENYEAWPTAMEDFFRASLKGYEFAAENPEAAVAHAFELINVAGNPFFLAEAHELNRWAVEQEVVETVRAPGLPVGQLDPERLGEEIQVLTDLGVFEELPDWESMINTDVMPKLYDDSGALIYEPMNG